MMGDPHIILAASITTTQFVILTDKLCVTLFPRGQLSQWEKPIHFALEKKKKKKKTFIDRTVGSVLELSDKCQKVFTLCKG